MNQSTQSCIQSSDGNWCITHNKNGYPCYKSPTTEEKKCKCCCHSEDTFYTIKHSCEHCKSPSPQVSGPLKSAGTKVPEEWEKEFEKVFKNYVHPPHYQLLMNFIGDTLATERQKCNHNEVVFTKDQYLEVVGAIREEERQKGYDKGQQDALNGIHPPLQEKIKRLIKVAQQAERRSFLESILEYYDNLGYDENEGNGSKIFKLIQDLKSSQENQDK